MNMAGEDCVGQGKKMMWRDHRYFNHPTVELFLNKQFKFQKKYNGKLACLDELG